MLPQVRAVEVLRTYTEKSLSQRVAQMVETVDEVVISFFEEIKICGLYFT
jgi:hypothetical protein